MVAIHSLYADRPLKVILDNTGIGLIYWLLSVKLTWFIMTLYNTAIVHKQKEEIFRVKSEVINTFAELKKMNDRHEMIHSGKLYNLRNGIEYLRENQYDNNDALEFDKLYNEVISFREKHRIKNQLHFPWESSTFFSEN